MVYLLGLQPASDIYPETGDYFLCSLKTGITQACSTRFNASSSGQTLEALCGPEYRYDGVGSTNNDITIPNWRDIGFDFLNAMSLQTGIMDGMASYPRILTQMQLREPKLDPKLPSPAEALLAMASCTALDLVQEIPFVPFWVWFILHFPTLAYKLELYIPQTGHASNSVF
jgi:hypothetical protein